MVRMPQNILAAMGEGKPGLQATYMELANELINNGYGEVKAKRWIDTLIDSGAIRLIGSDAIYGRDLYVCKWWGSVATITRIKQRKITVELTEEEAELIRARRARA